uniref:Ig-like domain-containing protein n=1 Tax=Sparus aurata TaxID=8175 RepID=A0A671TPF3_SPAAU
LLCFCFVFKMASELISSHQPIVALAGDDVILPCQLQPLVSVSSEMLLWTKPGLDPKYIHVHEAGRPMLMNQNRSYYNRTALFVDQLMNGNVSLKLFRVKLSDAGRYTCIIDSKKMEASVQLIVDELQNVKSESSCSLHLLTTLKRSTFLHELIVLSLFTKDEI